MKLLLGGVRGGSPVADAAYTRYGGDTSAFLIEATDGGCVIVDGGTGLRGIRERWTESHAPGSLLMLFTHFHHDHIIGLPAFVPMYDPDWTLGFASREMEGHTIEDIMKFLVTPPIWPLRLDELQATKQFRVLEDERIEDPDRVGGLEIRWCPTHHPGGSTAFRFDEPSSDSSVLIATDLEWAESTEAEQEMFRRLCATPGAPDVIVFDGKYSRANYEPCRGWGHSTWEEGIEIARGCDAKRLLITHHSTEYDDAKLDRLRDELQAAWPNADLARQGEVIELG